MNKLFIVIFTLSMGTLSLVGCTTTEIKQPKPKWKVVSKTGPQLESEPQSNFVPSGTELVFTQYKKFNQKDHQINIELSPFKRCTLSTTFDKDKEVELTENTLVTVVGYRGETDELVLSEPSYHQYYLSCMDKREQKRKTSSLKGKKVQPIWKKATVGLSDLQKMSPLFQIKYIPQ